LKCDEKETPRDKSFEPESPYVIVCEGFQDAGFIKALLGHLKITNCDVTFPKKRRDGANGKDGIPQIVKLLAPRDITGIAIVRDADDDPIAAFNEAKAAFIDPFVAPDASFTLKNGKRRTGVFLIPGIGKRGTLDHILFDAVATTLAPVAACVNAFQACARAQWRNEWSENRKAKMKMHSVIASFCEDDPGCSLGFIWAKGQDNPLDISNPIFKELSDFLTEFSTP
jgi:hypothetical protein